IVAACIAEDAADGLGAKQRPRYEAGCRDGWAPAGPPHKQRYLRYGGSGAEGEGEGAGALLERVRRQLLCTPAFARLLKAFTSITMLGQAGETRRFRPGMDYTVAHYGILTTDPRLDVVLTFVDDATDEAASLWQSVNYVRLEDFRPPAPPADVLARRKARKGRGAAGGGGGGGGGAGAGGGGQAGAGAGPEEEERVTIDMIKIRLDASANGCTGMFWRSKPDMNASVSAPDWPRNGAVFMGWKSQEHPGWVKGTTRRATGCPSSSTASL
ncbi:hypothetical protein HYH02_015548, partial [Chlamydomonas schloesseri]